MKKPSILKLLLLCLIFITMLVFSAIMGITMLRLMIPSLPRYALLLFAISIIVIEAYYISKEYFFKKEKKGD